MMSILQNEKYKGDALLQKKFTVDFLTKKQKVKDDFEKKYSTLSSRHEVVTAEIDRFSAEKEKRQCRDRELRIFIKALKSQPAAMTEWSDRPWVTLLDHAKVCADGKMIFVFKDGTEIGMN